MTVGSAGTGPGTWEPSPAPRQLPALPSPLPSTRGGVAVLKTRPGQRQVQAREADRRWQELTRMLRGRGTCGGKGWGKHGLVGYLSSNRLCSPNE